MHTKCTFVNLRKCVTTVLDNYSKQKSALSISYDAISSTDTYILPQVQYDGLNTNLEHSLSILCVNTLQSG